MFTKNKPIEPPKPKKELHAEFFKGSEALIEIHCLTQDSYNWAIAEIQKNRFGSIREENSTISLSIQEEVWDGQEIIDYFNAYNDNEPLSEAFTD